MPSKHSTPFAKKSLGQNFLVDQNYIGKIVAALDPKSGETIVEIGPGRGAITERLVESGAEILAIELDRDLASALLDRFSSFNNFSVFEADATAVSIAELAALSNKGRAWPLGSIKLVANLPYYISTAILQKLSAQTELFSSLVLMFQKEVVDRITARPGSSDRGFLTVLVESAFDVEKLFDVPPEAFRPVPKVMSSVVRLIPKPTSVADEPAFRKLISQAFLQKRKTILNNLKSAVPDAAAILAKTDIDPTRRAETLSLEEWRKLFSAIR